MARARGAIAAKADSFNRSNKDGAQIVRCLQTSKDEEEPADSR